MTGVTSRLMGSSKAVQKLKMSMEAVLELRAQTMMATTPTPHAFWVLTAAEIYMPAHPLSFSILTVMGFARRWP